MYTYEAIQVGLSADECQRLRRDIQNLSERDLADYDKILLRDLKRRQRIAKRLLSKRQLRMFE